MQYRIVSLIVVAGLAASPGLAAGQAAPPAPAPEQAGDNPKAPGDATSDAPGNASGDATGTTSDAAADEARGETPSEAGGDAGDETAAGTSDQSAAATSADTATGTNAATAEATSAESGGAASAAIGDESGDATGNAIPGARFGASDGATDSARGPDADTEVWPDTGPGEVIEMVDRSIPGSAQVVSAEDLARFEHDDVHQVLGAVPGVYIREEDGYGLRPNIGMRGVDSERSAKIALMEDGVPIAPAPYAAPAAYYFPLVTRMERVEVVKGPGAIVYGPNTVGGSINLVGKEVPQRHTGAIDLAVGQTLYSKIHGYYGASSEHIGVLVEGINLRSDGFKEIDGGGDSGFDKNDIQLKLRLNSDTGRDIYHQLDLKAGYSDEISNETYTGLSDADFAQNPYRRYSATQLDRMEWDHIRTQLGYRVDLGSHTRLTATLYHNRFSRTWAKLSGLANSEQGTGSAGDDYQRLRDALEQPDQITNRSYYQIITGEGNSLVESVFLRYGTNAREFVSQGIQLAGHTEGQVFGSKHTLEAGLRMHQDQVDRFHFEESYAMMEGEMVRSASPMEVTRDATAEARALAAHVQDKVEIAGLSITAGIRGEFIANQWRDRQDAVRDYGDSYFEIIPGIGAIYSVLPTVDLLAGVHKGFGPVAPAPRDCPSNTTDPNADCVAPEVNPEESINYEAGVRYTSDRVHAEVIGFFNNYDNLKGDCSYSDGCSAEDVDSEYNANGVYVFGVEALAGAELAAGPVRIPLRGSYTFTRSRFLESFTADDPKLDSVAAGDEMPYLPAHQVSAQAGVAGAFWEVALAGRFTSAMRVVAGQGPTEEHDRTDAYTVLDLAANVDFGVWGKAYLTVANLLDQTYIVSRHPYGVRPGKPRLAIVGYKYAF